jgi:hypothetical protein
MKYVFDPYGVGCGGIAMILLIFYPYGVKR